MKNLKKSLAVLLAVILTFSIMAIGTTASAADYDYVSSDKMYGYVVSNGKATITLASDGLMGKVEIPSKFDKYPVTAIGECAFENCNLITDIVVPDSVKEIGECAFCGCTALKSIDLGDGAEDFPFEILEAPLLEEIIIGKSVKIDSNKSYFFNIYDSYDNLSFTVSSANPNLDVVDGVLYADNMTHLLYYPLSSIAASYTMPASVKGVWYPLYLAKNLQKIEYNDKFSIMGDCEIGYEMIKCLDDVSEDSVMMADIMSYIIPVNVGEITVNSNNPYLTAEDDVLYNKNKSIIIRYAANRENNVFEIGPDVHWMATEALSGARNLELTISDGFTENINNLLIEIGADAGVVDAMSTYLSSSAAKNFTVADTNKYFKVENGVLYNKSMTDLIKYPIDSYGNYYELPATVRIENLIDEDDHYTSAFASLAGYNMSVYPEYITASGLTVHVDDACLEVAKELGDYTVIALAFLGVEKICVNETSVELNAYNKTIESFIEMRAYTETELESLEEMHELLTELYDKLTNGSADARTAITDYANAMYELGYIENEDRQELISELKNMSDEELEYIAAMLPGEVAASIIEVESVLYSSEYTIDIGRLDAICVKMAVCGGDHLYEIVWRNAPVSIKTPSVEELDYGETLILHAKYTSIPEGAKLVWTVTGEGVEIVPSEDGTTCAVISTDKGTATVKLTVVAENGTNVKDENGVELGSEQVIKSNSNLWLKIVSFFKNLFGINRTIEQSIVIR